MSRLGAAALGLVGAAALACGGSQKPPPPVPEDPELTRARELTEDIGSRYDMLGKVVRAAGDNCDNVALGIRVWVDVHKQPIIDRQPELSAISPAHQKQLMPDFDARLAAAARDVVAASKRCEGHQPTFDAVSLLRF